MGSALKWRARMGALALALLMAPASSAQPPQTGQPIVGLPVRFDPSLERLPPAQLVPPTNAQTPGGTAPPILHQHTELELQVANLAHFEQTALANHPSLIAAWHAVDAAEGKAWQARRYPNPHFGVASPQLAGSESQYNTFLSQDVLTGGKLRLDQAAACQQVEQARLAMNRARLDVLTDVRRKFFAALAAQNRVAVLDDIVKLSARSRQIGDALLKGGEGTKTDTLLLDIELAKSEVALQNAHTVLDSSRRRLAVAAGVPTLPVETLYGDLAAESFRLDIAAAQEEAALFNPQSAIAQSEAQRARILLDRAAVEPYPTFNVMGGYQHQLIGVRDQGIFQVTMSVPLWDRNRGGIRAAQSEVGRADAEVRRVQLELSGQAAEAFGRYQSALSLVAKYQQGILPRARETVDLTQRLYENQQIDFLRLLSAQRTLSDVNLGYIDAQAARWDAAAELANLLQMEQFP
jgi:cobalt-zinc-cadmium efflux system outer membrane protein